MTILSIIGIIFAIGVILFVIGILKNNKIMKYSGLFLIVLLIILIIAFFGYSMYSENKELKLQMGGTLTQNDMLPVPDRIIYKSDDSSYYIITPTDNNFDNIFTEISNRVDMISSRETITNDEIIEIKNKEKFIELDYNTKSKNKIFPLEEDYIGMINMLSDGGQIVKRGLLDKDKLIEVLEKAKKRLRPYKFESGQIYISTNNFSDIIPSENYGFKEKEYAIYQTVIDNQETLEKVCEYANFSSNISISNIDFSEKDIIMTITKYDIDKVVDNIGNINFYFKNLSDNYKVSIYVVSKIVNSNCIYCNIDYSYIGAESEVQVNPNYTTKNGIVQTISDSQFEIGLTSDYLTNIITITNETQIKDYVKGTEITLDDIKSGDSVYIEGNIISPDNDLEKIEASNIFIYRKEELKKYFEEQLKDTYRIDGYGISKTDESTYIIIELGFFEGTYNFIYPIKLNINSQTETYLGMNRHLQSNYGYVLHEMCDITLDKKITDIDNVQSYVKMIEYIAD